LLVDEKGVSEEGVVVAARGGELVEAVNDGADGGVGRWVLRRTVRGGQGESAGGGGQGKGRSCESRFAMEGFGQVYGSGSPYTNLQPHIGRRKLAKGTGVPFHGKERQGATQKGGLTAAR